MSEAYSKELIAKALEIAKEKVSRYSKVYTSAHKVLLSKLRQNTRCSVFWELML